MQFDPLTPYDVPRLPPAVELETKAILKLCISARAALAEMNVAALQLPNPDILISSMSLQEAKASSEIESIVTTDDALFRQAVLDDATADPMTKEALRYRNALYQGYQALAERPVTTRTAIEICRVIKGTEQDIRKIPGTVIRRQPLGQIIYTPPTGETRIREMLANWERFIHERTDIEPLVRIAAQHYQFEAIHPFHDGNGRTGRILNVLLLIQMNLLARPVLYLSREFLGSRSDYYELLQSVTTNGAWHEWIMYFIQMVEAAALSARIRILHLGALREHTEKFLSTQQPITPKLLDILFAQPYCRIANIVDAGLARRQAAAQYLHRLAAAGVVKEVKAGRGKLFLHKKLLLLLSGREKEIMKYEANSMVPEREPLFPSTSRSA